MACNSTFSVDLSTLCQEMHSLSLLQYVEIKYCWKAGNNYFQFIKLLKSHLCLKYFILENGR